MRTVYVFQDGDFVSVSRLAPEIQCELRLEGGLMLTVMWFRSSPDSHCNISSHLLFCHSAGIDSISSQRVHSPASAGRIRGRHCIWRPWERQVVCMSACGNMCVIQFFFPRFYIKSWWFREGVLVITSVCVWKRARCSVSFCSIWVQLHVRAPGCILTIRSSDSKKKVRLLCLYSGCNHVKSHDSESHAAANCHATSRDAATGTLLQAAARSPVVVEGQDKPTVRIISVHYSPKITYSSMSRKLLSAFISLRLWSFISMRFTGDCLGLRHRVPLDPYLTSLPRYFAQKWRWAGGSRVAWSSKDHRCS